MASGACSALEESFLLFPRYGFRICPDPLMVTAAPPTINSPAIDGGDMVTLPLGASRMPLNWVLDVDPPLIVTLPVPVMLNRTSNGVSPPASRMAPLPPLSVSDPEMLTTNVAPAGALSVKTPFAMVTLVRLTTLTPGPPEMVMVLDARTIVGDV
jgi:hypothetical protein